MRFSTFTLRDVRLFIIQKSHSIGLFMTKKQLGWMIILAMIVFTNILESMILMPLASTIKLDLGMDEKQWGVAISSYLFSAFFAGIISIFLIDRFDRKRFLTVLYALFIVGTFLCGIAQSFEFLVFARIFAGFFGGVISAVVLAIVGDVIQPEHRGKATGIVMAGFSSAAALGIPLGLYLGLTWTWHTPFIFIVGMSVLTWFFLVWQLPPLRAHLEREAGYKSYHIFKRVAKNGNQIRALIFTCTILFGQFAIIPYLADYVEQNIGFEKPQLVWMYFFGGGLTFVTNPFVGYLADKFGQLKTFLVLMLLSLIPIVAITSMGENPMPLVLLATTSFFIFAGGRNIPGTALVLSTAAPFERGGFMSIRSAMQQFASGIAVMLGSFILYQDEMGKYFNFEYVGYLAVGTSIASYFLLRTIKQEY
jgi:predicted MFS family arabinose efflux permease